MVLAKKNKRVKAWFALRKHILVTVNCKRLTFIKNLILSASLTTPGRTADCQTAYACANKVGIIGFYVMEVRRAAKSGLYAATILWCPFRDNIPFMAHLKKHDRCLGGKKNTRRPFLADSRNYCFPRRLTINLTRLVSFFLLPWNKINEALL